MPGFLWINFKNPNIQKINKALRWFVAEIAIVTVGILIAFQVEEWRRDRLDRGLEVDILASMLVELDEHHSAMQDYRQVVIERTQAGIDLDVYLRSDGERVEQEIVELFKKVWKIYTWGAESPVYISWRDSGRVDLISDPELRNAIYSYHNTSLTWIKSLSETNGRERDQFLRAAISDIYRIPANPNDDPEELRFRIVRPLESMPRNAEFFGLLNTYSSNSAFLVWPINQTIGRNRALSGKITAHLESINP